MENNIDLFYQTCLGIVQNCGVKILMVNLFGQWKAYLASSVNLKNRECRYSEAIEAQDITVLVKNYQSNFAAGLTEQVLMEKVQSINKVSFKFGTDEYCWITKCDLNRG